MTTILQEFVELNEAETTADMFWNALESILQMSDTSSDKTLIHSIMDHQAFRTLMSRSRTMLRSKLKGEARQRLILLLRTINNAHKQLKKDAPADDKAPKADDVKAKTKPKLKEEKKIEATDKVEPEKVEVDDDGKSKGKDDNALSPDELPKIIKRMIELADPEDNKKLARTIMGLSPMKTLLARARAVSSRVSPLVRKRMEDFEAALIAGE